MFVRPRAMTPVAPGFGTQAARASIARRVSGRGTGRMRPQACRWAPGPRDQARLRAGLDLAKHPV